MLKIKIVPFTFLLLSLFPKIIFGQFPGGLDTLNVGPYLWMKANSQTGKVTLAGTNVSAWADEMSPYSITQSTASKRPTFVSSYNSTMNFNFNPCIDFNSSLQTILSNSVGTDNKLGTDGTVLVVANSGSDGHAISYGGSNSNRVQFKPFWRVQNGNNNLGYVGDIGSSGVGPTNANFGFDAARILVNHGCGSASNVRLNSKVYPLNFNGVSTYYPAVPLGIMMGGNTSTNFFNDALSELLIFPFKLNATQINKVESYLAIKYGITLDSSTNYVMADGTIFWNSANYPTYHHNITGIWRDNASDLFQKQSKSVHKRGLVSLYYGPTAGLFPAMNVNNSSNFGNKEYVIFGDNGMSDSLTQCFANGYIAYMERVWFNKQSAGMNTAMGLQLQKSQVNPLIKNVLVSSDPTFPLLSTTIYPLIDNGTYLWADVVLGDSVFFTFASDSINPMVIATPSYCTSSSGTASVTCVDGGGQYSYSWSSVPTQTGPLATGLSAGSLILTVNHGVGNACSVSQTVAIPFATYDLNVTDNIINEVCSNSNGSILLSTNNTGTAPYIYSINGGLTNQALSLFSNLAAGTYPILVTDNNGCTNVLYTTDVININHPPNVQISFLEPKCHGDSNGMIQITAISGSGPFTYFSSPNNISNNTGTFLNLKSGTYNLKVTDAENCILDTPVLLAEPQDMDIVSEIRPSCWLDPTGRVTITGFGGTPDFEFALDNSDFISGNLIDSISAGSHTLYMMDSHGCLDSSTVKIPKYSPFSISSNVIPATCGRWTSGKITLKVEGVSSPYFYEWKQFPNEIILNERENLFAGYYNIEVRDVNFCRDTVVVFVPNDCCRPFAPIAFTPNGDNLNDNFTYIAQPNMIIKKFEIFNRYGERIYYSSQPTDSWDGKYNGKDCDIGTYMYQVVAVCIDGETISSGSIELIR